MYLASHGARIPFLAVLSLRRPRNLVLVLASFALVPVALLVRPLLEPDLAAGLLGIAIAPGAFSAPALLGRLGGRRDTAGALVVGTAIASFGLVLFVVPGIAIEVLPAIQAFALAATVAAAAPRLRDLALGPITWFGDLALLALLGAAIASGPRLDLAAFAVAGAAAALLVVSIAALAAVTRRDLAAALAALASRDPATSVAVAVALGGAAASGPSLALLLIELLGAALIARNLRKPA